MTNQYNLRELPAHELIQPQGDEPATWLRPDGSAVTQEHAESVIKWSGKRAVPALGAPVKINMNQLGTGTVIGYFIEHGFLGVEVKLDKAPKWHVKQNGPGASALVFGNELEFPKASVHDPEPAPTPVGVRGVAHSEKRDRQAKNRRSRYPQSRRVTRGEG